MKKERFDPAPVMARLKDFQRKTVDYVFQRMYLDTPPAPRFLVADEVGLGKTLVARGLISQALAHLDDEIERIDVIYVCSNAAIAAQNLHRLNVAGREGFNLPTRLTLLPKHVSQLQDRHINFISFTPGTTFDLKSSGGVMEERSLIYRMLQDEQWLDTRGFLHLLRCTAGDRWESFVKWDSSNYDENIARKYRTHVRNDKKLRKRIEELCEVFHRKNANTNGFNADRYALVGDLRRRLGMICLDALEPDLVILDEFQRFRDLLDGKDEAADLARQLFDYPNVRVLLLSATPYKMLALDHEGNDDHYPDFLRTLGFLFKDPSEEAAVREEIRRFRQALFSLAAGDYSSAKTTREALQSRLSRVMCRTERVSMTVKLDAMLGEPKVNTPVASMDLSHAMSIGRACRELGAGDSVEYWKSSPYLLNFLRGYDFRRRLENGKPPLTDELLRVLQDAREHQLRHGPIKRYEPIDPANARMRALFSDTLDRGLWQILWMPPSMPYMAPSGPFASVGGVTKSLIFSSWNMVPDAIATVCSYEAERRMVEGLDQVEDYEFLYRQIKPLLKFTVDQEGRRTGMPAMALCYPSPTLAGLIDPLRIALHHEGQELPTPEDVLDIAELVLRQHLARLTENTPSSGPVDQRWYWAAPAILDADQYDHVISWCQDPGSWALSSEENNGQDEEDDAKGFPEHVALFSQTMRNELAPPLGRPPADLARVLAELALAGPGICALRALYRIAPAMPKDDPRLLTAAAHIAGGFRTLFNLPESIALLRGAAQEDSYWRTTLNHGITGNLQALLDEQVHVLQESLGLLDVEPEECVEQIALDIGKSVSLRTVRLGLEEVRVKSNEAAVSFKDFRLRCRFALRFADIKDEKNQITRADTVRSAFNSPFRPFVLASTSIGQEGLDFHVWCHSVTHWNLPSNPVDLEQREGRVHRYKGHAVRKNIVMKYGLAALRRNGWEGAGDPWCAMFDLAVQEREATASDLVPYWIFEVDGGACVERRVPMLPFSREIEHLRRLKKSLALYRLVFGQPRQEDLLIHLADQVQDESARDAILEHRISLAPKTK